MVETIEFTLNGESTRLTVDTERMLLWVLRSDLGLTGTKHGCNEGYCGACSILVDDYPERSCMVPVKDIVGKEVVTIEGLAGDDELLPIQEAFINNDALQCGYCTPGMIINAYSLLNNNPNASREEILTGLDENLCRCGAHQRIVRAVEEAAELMKR